tara:strand:- start:684 stop:959 length:276 start_codon:yes stop_codon:yes gene_type:complete
MKTIEQAIAESEEGYPTVFVTLKYIGKSNFMWSIGDQQKFEISMPEADNDLGKGNFFAMYRETEAPDVDILKSADWEVIPEVYDPSYHWEP